ncbi:MAG: FtsX-like permease family protein [Syntrophobacteraceae bacterium]
MGRIDKQKNILDFTLSSLLRRKGRNLSLALVYTLIVFTLGSVVLFTQAMKKEASIILRDTPEIVIQKMVAGRHDLIPVSYIDKIVSIRGVGSVSARLWGYYFDTTCGANYTLVVPKNQEITPGEIVIGRGIARERQSEEGDELSVKAFDGEVMTFTIKQVMSSESELVASDLMLLREADFRRLFGIPEQYATDLVLNVANRKELNTIASKVVQILPDTRPILRDEILRTYDAVFNWRGGLVFIVLAGAIFAFIILAWDKATGLSAEEKKEIGILKAIGWDTSDVLLMKFWESSVISLSSFSVGILLAYLHVFLFSSSLFEPVLKGWSVLYPAFKPAPFIDFYNVAILFFITVLPYTVATIIPSWRAAIIDPDAVMR